MPRTRIRPNPQLKQIVLEETNDGRDVVRYLKSIIVDIEGAPQLYGLRAKDYARSHKIAAARILARIGLEEGKRYLRRTYVRTPFRRVHPEDEDGPKREMAASTSELYRLVKKETNDGRDIIIRFLGIMKGYHPEYKPHLRMAAAKELIRQIEFDYDDEPARPEPVSTLTDDPTPPTPSHTESASPSEPVGASLVAAHADTPDESTTTDSQITPHHQNHTNHSSDSNNPHPDYPVHPANPDSDREPDAALQAYRECISRNCVPEAESIYQSIIRRASDRPDLDSARQEAEKLIEDFNRFIAERAPDSSPVNVPDDILARSLTGRIESSELPFDPADYYHLDQDDFFYCQCRACEDCDELDFFIEFMSELEEETDDLLEDP